MKVRAIQRNVHVASRKANLVCALIRNKKATEAIVILDNTGKKTARIMKKILNSAIANATNNHSMDVNKLYVYGAFANQGRTIKRSMPRARGAADMIKKRHSHLEIVLSDDPNQRQVDMLAPKAKAKKVKASKVNETKIVTKKKGDK
jgi:ribosomal protein L22